MQTATIMLALAGDKGNTVPKFGVTPGEVAVLRAIHGDDAVFDIEINDGEKTDPDTGEAVSNAEDLARLRHAYSRAKIDMGDGQTHRVVDSLFPGIGARTPEEFAVLDIPDEFYKATQRATPDTKPAPKKATKAASKKSSKKTEPETVDEGVGEDMADAGMME